MDVQRAPVSLAEDLEEQTTLLLDQDEAGAMPEIDAASVQGARSWSVVSMVGGSKVAAVLLSAAMVLVVVAFAGRAAAGDSAAVEVDRTFARDLLDDEQAAHTRELTGSYIKVRMANDLDGILELFAPDAKFHLDLNSLWWLVRQNIQSKTGTDYTGPQQIARYYKAFPTKAQDATPDSATFECDKNTCIVRDSVHRSFATVKTKAVFTWNEQDKIQSLRLKLS